ncbi:hypothetical protein [Parasitella parasitica]|uniref:Uncharacterized protein n=1 Tax=Parasitella parasitica TaxID=35722 RepID=A0A0B7NVG9_9FUNG|nr:hypothetical protein [Parasitella parasitica]
MTMSNDEYGDIYDGNIFKSLYNGKVLNNDPDVLNLYLKIDIDGFTCTHSHNSLVMVHGVLLNLDSSERYARHATFQIAILPSKAKGDFDSFMAPIVDEINLLSKKNLVVASNGDELVKCRVYVLFVNGDGIEANRMLNFQGHMSTYGCRFCIAKGEHRVDGNKATGMYFADRNAPLRTKESLLLKDKSALFKENAYGINKPTVLAKLSTFLGVESIGLEELHAISNISALFYEMISPRYNANFKYIGNEAAYPFQLSNLQFNAWAALILLIPPTSRASIAALTGLDG